MRKAVKCSLMKCIRQMLHWLAFRLQEKEKELFEMLYETYLR